MPKSEAVVEKTVSKPSGKAATKKGKGKQPETKSIEVANEVHIDPIAEKLRQQR